jgi:hypothetical protein
LANDLDRNFDPSREAMGRIATLVEDIKSLQAEIEAFSKTTVCLTCLSSYAPDNARESSSFASFL